MKAANSGKSILQRALYRSLLRTARPYAPALYEQQHQNYENKEISVPDVSHSNVPNCHHNSAVLPSLLHRSWLSSIDPTTGSESDWDDDDDYEEDGISRHRRRNSVNNGDKIDDDVGLYYSLLVEYMSGGRCKQSCNGDNLGNVALDESGEKDDGVGEMSKDQVLKNISMSGPMMRFPSQISQEDMSLLVDMIRREFRLSAKQHAYTVDARMQCGFRTLAELNKKLSWYNNMLVHRRTSSEQYVDVVADGVKRISPQQVFQPGAYLVAHPLQTGYFAQTVVVILDHSEEGGTYGLVVNRSKGKTFQEVLQVDRMPKNFVDSFGTSIMRDGGPVHVSVQMMYSCTADEEAEFAIGGSVLPYVDADISSQSKSMSTQSYTAGINISSEMSDNNSDNDQSPPVSQALHSDEAIFFKGNVGRASQLISGDDDDDNFEKKLESEKFTFFSGSSVWESGQLDSEIERGFWMPASGPPSIALSGKCKMKGDAGRELDGNELWMAMMSSFGKDEADLARITLNHNDESDYGLPCDEL